MAKGTVNFKVDSFFEGADELYAAIEKLKKRVAKEYMLEAIKTAIAHIKSQLVDAVPVRTGKMRKAVQAGKTKATTAEAEGYVWIRKKGGYQAHLIEYGHRKVVRDKLGRKIFKGFQPPNPFFRNTMQKNERLILSIFQDTLRKKLIEGRN